MTDLTLEALRAELREQLTQLAQVGLTPIRDRLERIENEQAFTRRAVVATQQDSRALKGTFNDFARVQPTSGEIEALHDEVNRVESQNAELQIRLDGLERRVQELQDGRR